jgi:hypothetical protein
MQAATITLALAAAVLAALILDLRAARGEAGGRAATVTLIALVATVIAALMPFGVLIPHPSLAHVAPVPSWDLIRPCVAPPEPSTHGHALGPLAIARLVFPVIVAAALGAAARPIARPRRVLAVSLAFALAIVVLGGARVLRGGADLEAFRSCGALTPEEGADASRVRAVIDRMLVDSKQELIRWRDLPRLPRPPWVRSEIPVTIAGEPWVLRVRRGGVVAEPDDPRRADRPLPVLHFSSVPHLARNHVGTVLVDHRPDGKLYAIRVGRPVQPNEIGPLLRAPAWPVLLTLAALAVAGVALYVTRDRNERAALQPPYRTAASEPLERPLRSAVPAIVALLLMESSATALHALLPYL